MAVYMPVVRKYHVGDHVGLEAILAVGEVIARRRVIPGIGHDDGSGRYLVEFGGVPEHVHGEMLRVFCQCKSHTKASSQLVKLQRRSQRKSGSFDADELQKIFTEAERNCESEYVEGDQGTGKSRIWYPSESLLNCSGKERLPLNANVTYGTKPPYFDITPMGTWTPSEAPRYRGGS